MRSAPRINCGQPTEDGTPCERPVVGRGEPCGVDHSQFATEPTPPDADTMAVGSPLAEIDNLLEASEAPSAPAPGTLLESASEAGRIDGDRAARDARRLRMSFDDWPGADFAERQVERALHRDHGVGFEAAPIDVKVELVSKYVTAFRDAYSAEYYRDCTYEDSIGNPDYQQLKAFKVRNLEETGIYRVSSDEVDLIGYYEAESAYEACEQAWEDVL